MDSDARDHQRQQRLARIADRLGIPVSALKPSSESSAFAAESAELLRLWTEMSPSKRSRLMCEATRLIAEGEAGGAGSDMPVPRRG